MALSETHGRVEHPCEIPAVDGYRSWCSDRSGMDKGGGGMTLLYKECLVTHEYNPAVPSELSYIANERQWLLICSGSDKIAFLSIYMACNTTRNDEFLRWNEDLLFLVSQESARLRLQGFAVVSMGDYNSRVGRIPGLEDNTPDVNRNSPMFFNFVKECNLFIVNTLPIARGLFTRFFDVDGCNISKSLLDYALVDQERVGDVSSFVIDEFARVSAGSDHALLELEISFGHRPRVCWQYQDAIQYNYNESSDFSGYRESLEHGVCSILMEEFEKLTASQMLAHISENITNTAKGVFGIKTFKRDKKRGRRLPLSLRKLILEKKTFAVRLVKSKDEEERKDLSYKISMLKDIIDTRLCQYRLQRRTRLRSRLLLKDPNRRKFWRFLRKQASTAGRISAMKNGSGEIVFGQQEIEDCVLNHFQEVFGGSPVPVYAGEVDPHSSDTSEQSIGDRKFPSDHFEDSVCAPYTSVELDKILKELPKNKSSGMDNISNELLTHAGPWFRKYLLMFLNRVMKDGEVPEALNSGKCIILHKVCCAFLIYIGCSIFLFFRQETRCYPQIIDR